APPLDGIWATAPYFHNGSVPTVYGVLDPSARPQRFRRLPGTDAEVYDCNQLGWKVETIEGTIRCDQFPAIEARKGFDCTQPGKSNSGHIFGEHLIEFEKVDVI